MRSGATEAMCIASPCTILIVKPVAEHDQTRQPTIVTQFLVSTGLSMYVSFLCLVCLGNSVGLGLEILLVDCVLLYFTSVRICQAENDVL